MIEQRPFLFLLGVVGENVEIDYFRFLPHDDNDFHRRVAAAKSCDPALHDAAMLCLKLERCDETSLV